MTFLISAPATKNPPQRCGADTRVCRVETRLDAFCRRDVNFAGGFFEAALARWRRRFHLRSSLGQPKCLPHLILALLAVTASASTVSMPGGPPNLQGISIEQHLGAPLPLDTVFTDGNGDRMPLRAYISERPVVLAMVYYTCPMLCSQILSGMVAGLRPLSLEPGRDFDVLAISINPQETARDAAAKRDLYSHQYSRKAGIAGWHFLVGSQESIQQVADAVGFHFRYDPASKMFFHASGIMVLTPQGRVARYLYGVNFEPKDLKLSLIEASGNRIGSPVDQVLLYCYHYDPSVGKYGPAVVNLLRATGALFFVGLTIVLAVMFRRDLRRYRHPGRGVSSA